MIRKKRFPTAALIGCLALALSACGGAAAPSGAATEGPSGEPVVGGSATVLVLAEPPSLDPAALGNNAAIAAAVGNALYGELVVNDTTTGEIQPRMAESFTSDDGGATFTLTLRDGLTFSDGSPLDAAAVKFNWDRMRDPATASISIGDAVLVAATEVVDPSTLRVTMTEPIPNFPQALTATSLNWIASPAALQAGRDSFDANPIGAGPYTLTEWRRQDAIELVRNPTYYDAPRPYLDSLTLRPALDFSQRFNTMISGGAEVALDTSWLNLSNAGQQGLQSLVQDQSGGNFLALNSRRAPFSDVRARQALAAAVDLSAINDAAYQGTGRAAETLFAESSPFYTPEPLHAVDRERAQQLFDELAAEGTPVSFVFKSFPTAENRAIAESVQAQLASYQNVTANIEIVDLAQAGALRQTFDFDALVSSAPFIDPEPQLFAAFAGDSRRNLPGVADAGLDAALQQGRVATSAEDRQAAYDEFQARFREVVPALFLFRQAPGVIAAAGVGGLRQYGNGSLLVEELWVQQE